jgi:1-aminocyclopropane-1-carboxylate deaminase
VYRVSTARSDASGLEPQLPSPLHELADKLVTRRGVRLYLKRDDLVHPEIPGNKWRKLTHNVVAASSQGQHVLLTFGGAYSNHIRATAAAGHWYGFSTIGVIRGEEHLPLNPTLGYAVARGMRLSYLDRATYRDKATTKVLDRLEQQFGRFYLLPEGGSNALALRGCAELPPEIDVDYDVLCCSVGTGGTLAGIAAGMPDVRKRVLGFSALKGGMFLEDTVRRLQQAYGTETTNWSIETDYHFGGYARRTAELDGFVENFRMRHGIVLDWVYEAKMMYGLLDLIEAGRFARGTVLVAVLAG